MSSAATGMVARQRDQDRMRGELGTFRDGAACGITPLRNDRETYELSKGEHCRG